TGFSPADYGLARKPCPSARSASIDCKTFYIALRHQLFIELAEGVEVALQGVALQRPLPRQAAQLDREEGQLDELAEGHPKLHREVAGIDHDAGAAEGLAVGPDVGGHRGHAAGPRLQH